ncbi:gp17 [Sphingomonas phage PAU]|uniref:gp17 n=1 Tax=Sphingomonas phage PAU TaxID=1150991 RepID=UPI0002573116|nr:gp17 [Sphingomonas phage PAU]AFF28015.1 gp17 [Sphingomonas phage PAU]
MRKTYFSDKFKFLKNASLRSDDISASIDQYLASVFKNNNLKWLKTKLLAFSQTIAVVKELSTLIFYYIDAALTEANVFTAQKEVSVRNLAEISGHNVTRAISARGSVLIELMPQFSAEYGSQVRVKKYGKIATNQGHQYLINFDSDEQILSTNSNWILPVIEGKLETSTFIATGEELLTIHLDDINIIENYDVNVFVNNVKWNKAAGLYDMTINEEAYIIKTGYTNQVDIYFGTGINGKVPSVGDSIRIEYIVTSGFGGNISDFETIEFTFVDGVYDLQDEQIEVNELVRISKQSGFDLGNAGEDLDTTRLNVGFSSRTLVLSSSENFEAYLSRLPVSRVNVWSEYDNTAVKNLLILPRIKERVRSYKDYLTIDETDFVITDKMKDSIIELIDNSRKTYVTNELVFIDPIIRKYAILVYIESDQDILNRSSLYKEVTDTITSHFMNRIFSKNYSTTVSKAELINDIKKQVPEYLRINIFIVSDQNEEARINGFYEKKEYINKDGIKRIDTVRINIDIDENPGLGLSEYGDISVQDINEIPVLGKNVRILSNDNSVKTIVDPISVYIKDDNSWKLLS